MIRKIFTMLCCSFYYILADNFFLAHCFLNFLIKGLSILSGEKENVKKPPCAELLVIYEPERL